MKLCTFEPPGGGQAVGLVTDTGVVDLSARLGADARDLRRLIGSWPSTKDRVGALVSEADHTLGDVRILQPLVPDKTLCTGLNYRPHISETRRDPPRIPSWFPKLNTTLCGPFDDIVVPRHTGALDYEGELVLVIGRGGHDIAEDEALGHLFGCCIGNDVSARDFQYSEPPQLFLAKNFGGTAAIGPVVVTLDELDLDSGLELRTTVNGEPRQSATTSELVFSPARLIADVSRIIPLEAGDLVFTGTPGGVGAHHDPPSWLAPGDRVRVEIEGIGAIENRFVAN